MPFHSSSPDQKFILALFGKKLQRVEEKILNGDITYVMCSNAVMQENHSFRVISVPHFFDDNYDNPDQQVIDLMALTLPGPRLFMLAVDSEDAREEIVQGQIKKLGETLGAEVTSHLVIVLSDKKSPNSLHHLKTSNMEVWFLTEDLVHRCQKRCSGRDLCMYDFSEYTYKVVQRRMNTLEKMRQPGRPRQRGTGDEGTPGHLSYGGQAEARLNIVLLGLSGTGKSASANTILSAGTPPLPPSQHFKSEPNSLPVTTRCEFREIELFGRKMRVVDTPDFLHEDLQDRETQIEECKKYFHSGCLLVFLVIQISSFTDQEVGILERLEKMFGMRLRENTAVLLTHKEDLKGDPESFLRANPNLWEIIEMSGYRYHLFNNNSKDTKQVREMAEKFPEWFPDVQQSKSNKSGGCLTG